MSETDDSQDVGEEVQVKVKTTTKKLKREKELEELKGLLSIYANRAFYWRLLSHCGVYKNSYTGNSTTFFNEGKRAVGLWLLDEIFEASPTIFNQMQNEAVERGERK